MPRATNPITFSEHFNIDPLLIRKLGILDVTMAIDTRLFIDPLLLKGSTHEEMRTAAKTYRKRFENIVKLLAVSKQHGDVPWRNALRIMDFHEVGATCLGYGMAGVDGSGFGAGLIYQIATTGKQIVDLGINDPDIFALLALFEEGIGADRISDMTTTVILENLIDFTTKHCNSLGIPLVRFRIAGREANLPINPYGRRDAPLIFVPHDILRPLPVAVDRSEICNAASDNADLRNRVNADVSMIWSAKTRTDRARLRKQIVSDAKAMTTLLEVYHSIKAQAYDVHTDPEGRVRWANNARIAASEHPLKLKLRTHADAANVVSQIVRQFKFLIEDRGLWRNLYSAGSPLNEHYSQGLFFAIAHSYCKSNNLDLSPEVDTGSGRIDFKFSKGFSDRVIVEIKLSTNPNIVDGYAKQIRRYNQAEETTGGTYIVIDVGGMGKKDVSLLEVKNAAVKNEERPTDVVFIDALPKKSASKL